MASKNTRISAKNRTGNEVSLSHSQTDSPIIDVASLERLQSFRPDLVDFVINQTREEAENRRKEEKRIVTFTFIERMGGLLLAAVICSFGVFGSVYALNQGSEKLAMTIATVSIGTLAVAFLKRR